MSSRSRGRGGGRGFSRGGPPSRGGGREYYRGQGRPSGSRGGQDPDRLLSALGPEAKLALTQALVASVLGPESRNGYGGSGGGGGNYREGREGSYRSYREGRGGYKEDYHPREQQRRHFGDDRRPYYQQPRYEGGRSYREEERGRGRPRYERDGKPPMGSMRPRSNYHKYVGPSKRRSSPHDHPGASNKRQRPEELDGRDKPRRDVEDPNNDEKQVSNEDEEGKDLSGVAEGSGGKPSGVQVTIRADGERAVNSEGHVHVGGGMYRAYVELRCPHCPKQRSITFKEYKYHLASEAHKSQLNSLARKHSLVLRKIRVQQRQEQKDIEAKYEEEKPEEFKNAVRRFCNMCKLAFKNMPMEDNSLVHNRSKLHRIQKHYLHPRCLVCRITFPTRMVYEHHMASIKHLRVSALTAMLDKDGSQEDKDKKHDSEEEELDLRNFMTLDSVGEDDDEVGSEHEEITGGLDVTEIAEEDLAGGDEEVEGAPRKHGDVGLAWEKLQLEDDEEEEEEDQQPLGTDYVRRIQAYFCSLCHKIIRGDSSHGARAVRKHCRGVTHISHYNELHPPEQSDAEASGDEGEKTEECKNGKEEAEGETEAKVKEDEGEGEVEDEEAEGEEENEGEEAEADTEAEVKTKAKANVKVKAKAGDKEAEETEKVEDDKDAKEEEEIDEEEDEGMADEKEEGWDEEVGDDFSAP
ncbi:uncharacterized protein LOC143028152 isoform X2 [Oratosquilla oratoria]|uniref:uncharacterized protein LOC143028152 isoform X2 n=1 Tax=Oratosquilla oratoria TaxID=337810 RepID=UPI003F75EE6A